MYVLKKAITKGYVEGVKDGKEDGLNNKSKIFKINDIDLSSKAYDIGYIKGYNKHNNYKYVYKKRDLQ